MATFWHKSVHSALVAFDITYILLGSFFILAGIQILFLLSMNKVWLVDTSNFSMDPDTLLKFIHHMKRMKNVPRF